MLEELKKRVCEANLSLVKHGLVVLTWGNVSALSEDGQYVVIKPSGVSYEIMAQAEMDLPCYGTTHADYFFGSVPCTRHLTDEEIRDAYERSTGLVIAETFRERGIDPAAVPAVLVRKHGPFTWGPTPEKAVENALVLDECAHMALLTLQFSPAAESAPQAILDKHYYRKHGAGAYYGQK